MKEFDHIGIITRESHPGESWVEFSRVWVTNPRVHPNRIEYIRPESFPEIDPADEGLWKLWNLPHVAYRVDDLATAIAGKRIVLGPFEPADFGSVAFTIENGAVVEYLEYTTLEVWFGQPTLWRPALPPGAT